MSNAPLSSIAAEKGLVGGPFGSSLVRRDYVDRGIPVIRGANMSHGRYVSGDFVQVSEEKFGADLRRNAAFGGDLIYTQRGTLGQVALLRSDRNVHVVSQSQMRLRVDASKAVPLYVYYASTSPQFLWQIENRAISTGVPHINLGILGDLEIPLPPLPEQRAIAATLGALDDKIESNRRAIALIFKVAIATLTSGTERIRLGDLATVTKGLSYKGSGLDDGTRPEALPMLNLASFTTTGELKSAGTKWYTGEFKPQHALNPWEVLLANTDLTQSRELLGRGFLVPPHYEGALHTHHTSVVRFFDRSELSLPLWAQLQSATFRDRAKGFATGTTVAALPPEAVLDFELALPDDLDALLIGARLMIEKAWQLESETTRLESIRDTLLPELLSGRIRVPLEGIDA